MVGFSVSARLLVFWGIMLLAGTCGLSLFMLLALFSPTITVAAALQACRASGCGGPMPPALLLGRAALG